jgi:uncharacterized phage-associated protein
MSRKKGCTYSRRKTGGKKCMSKDEYARKLSKVRKSLAKAKISAHLKKVLSKKRAKKSASKYSKSSGLVTTRLR